MCGISGIIPLQKQRIDRNSIIEMNSIMKHRGPDDEGIFIDSHIGMGFVRLSIIDLSKAGNQPMISSDGRYIITFNGEIFNYVELKEILAAHGYRFNNKSDTEVLLNAFIHWGEDCVNYLNGMWAFAIYDKYEKTLFISRDRYGIKPLYYICTNNMFAYASEIPPLLSLLSGSPTVDDITVFDYLIFNRTDQTERTFYNEIKKLQHGNNITFNISKGFDSFRIHQWYSLKESSSKIPGFSSSKEFHDLFSDSVGIRLRSDVSLGVCLSGGLDSSSIVSDIVFNHGKQDLKTFSVVFGNNIKTDERQYIELYNNIVFKQYFKTLTAKDFEDGILDFVRAVAEPVPSGGPFAQFNVMKLAKGKSVVLLDGQGADEILGGYKYFWGYHFNDLIKQFRVIELLKELKVGNGNIYKFSTAFFYLLPPNLQTKFKSNSQNRFVSEHFIARNVSSSSLSNSLYQASNFNEALFNHMEYKLEHLLKWEDRNSMWFGLESRVPFLDYRIVERSLQTQSSLLIKRGYTKNILREAMQGEIPNPILERKDKIGFGAPKTQWFKENNTATFIEHIISENENFLAQYFLMPNIRKALLLNRTTSKDFSPIIWKAFNLALWHQHFIKNV